MKRNLTRVLLWSTALTLGVSASLAYVLSDLRWEQGTTTIHIAFPDGAESGDLFKDAVETAVGQWNETPFHFVVDESYVDPCTGYSRNFANNTFPAGDGDRHNSIDFRANVCGNSFGNDVLAITLNLGRSGTLGFDYLVESDIIFNSAFNWDIYSGPRRSSTDFSRVALHELGHVLGLGHELAAAAIMSPKIGDLDTLTVDDRAGAARLYGEPTTCPITALTTNSMIRSSLSTGDCQIRELYGNGNDTSFVDTYRLILTETTTLRLRMTSKTLDPVLLVTNQQLIPKSAVLDDSNGTCNVDEVLTLEAGTYLFLANTYVTSEKCAGNTGGYTFTVSDSPYPLLGNTGNARSGGTLSNALFSGHARLDSGTGPRNNFAATDRITVEGRINIDPLHVGKPGKIFVLATLGNGLQFMRNSAGQWPVFKGLGQLVPAWSRNLAAVEDFTIITGLRGSTTGLNGQDFAVFVGYALDEAPQDIHFGAEPLTFQIAP